MILNDVHEGITKNKPRTRLGRGPASGQGKTAGRGGKGDTARSGYHRRPTFQGTLSLVRRVPKRGFNNKFALTVVAVNVGDLEREFEAGEEVNADSLRAKALAQGRYDVLKILGDGDLTKRLKVSAHRFSVSAKEKIEKAGGQAIELPRPVPVEEKKKAKKAEKAAAAAQAKESKGKGAKAPKAKKS